MTRCAEPAEISHVEEALARRISKSSQPRHDVREISAEFLELTCDSSLYHGPARLLREPVLFDELLGLSVTLRELHNLAESNRVCESEPEQRLSLVLLLDGHEALHALTPIRHEMAVSILPNDVDYFI